MASRKKLKMELVHLVGGFQILEQKKPRKQQKLKIGGPQPLPLALPQPQPQQQQQQQQLQLQQPQPQQQQQQQKLQLGPQTLPQPQQQHQLQPQNIQLGPQTLAQSPQQQQQQQTIQIGPPTLAQPQQQQQTIQLEPHPLPQAQQQQTIQLEPQKLPQPQQQPQQSMFLCFVNNQQPSGVKQIRAKMPNWSVAEVVEFIESHEDIRQYSSRFVEHEVDGKALCIMIDRNLNPQSLSSMFKAGPAMKIEAALSKYKDSH